MQSWGTKYPCRAAPLKVLTDHIHSNTLALYALVFSVAYSVQPRVAHAYLLAMFVLLLTAVNLLHQRLLYCLACKKVSSNAWSQLFPTFLKSLNPRDLLEREREREKEFKGFCLNHPPTVER
jgi:hypothetical protein